VGRRSLRSLRRALDAFDAIALLKERDVDIPFLIVSEALGEETAVRAMKAGAQNCIPRASLGALCPILERELREAQIRRERRQRPESAVRERAALPHARRVVARRDPDGRRRRHAPLRQRRGRALFGYPSPL
jgi:DNA-binding NtrC family response regulator